MQHHGAGRIPPQRRRKLAALSGKPSLEPSASRARLSDTENAVSGYCK
jgi:hypothetical protein